MPSTSENRPADWAWVSPTSDGAVGIGGAGSGIAVDVPVVVAVAVGGIPCAATGACKLDKLSRAINSMTASNRTVVDRHLLATDKFNLKSAIGLRNLRRRCPHLSE